MEWEHQTSLPAVSTHERPINLNEVFWKKYLLSRPFYPPVLRVDLPSTSLQPTFFEACYEISTAFE